ncbi:hypothetical protein IW262DRAFT_1480696 [Armillaria fumosa]|nr:hypothetical protein IW262DRAFT_1480696 [Armillaria fumosa]
MRYLRPISSMNVSVCAHRSTGTRGVIRAVDEQTAQIFVDDGSLQSQYGVEEEDEVVTTLAPLAWAGSNQSILELGYIVMGQARSVLEVGVTHSKQARRLGEKKGSKSDFLSQGSSFLPTICHPSIATDTLASKFKATSQLYLLLNASAGPQSPRAIPYSSMTGLPSASSATCSTTTNDTTNDALYWYRGPRAISRGRTHEIDSLAVSPSLFPVAGPCPSEIPYLKLPTSYRAQIPILRLGTQVWIGEGRDGDITR